MIRILKSKAEYISVTVLSTVLFFIFYGAKILNPFYIDWILSGGDTTQHYLGWSLYRYAPFLLRRFIDNKVAYYKYKGLLIAVR